MKKLHSLIFLIFGIPFIALATEVEPAVDLEGRILEKGTRKPIADVNVYCIPQAHPETPLRARTDEQGKFRIQPVPEGEFHWIVNLTGYEKLEKDDLQAKDLPVLPRTLYLEKSSYDAYETTITDQAEKRDDRTKSMKQEEFLQAAGTDGDPVKAVQNLPGINRPPPFSALVILEGSSPNDTSYSIDTLTVPFIFHLGGLTTVITPEAIDRVELLPAGFGPEFGQTNAGYVSLYTRSPKNDGIHGFGFVDLFNAGALLETPLSDTSSILITARKSYIGNVLGLLAKNNSDFNLTAVPEFQDLTLIYENHLTPIDEFRWVTVGSADSLAFLLAQPINQDPSVRGQFGFTNAFFRLIPEWTHKFSSSTQSHIWMGFGRDWIGVNTAADYYNYNTYTLSSREELESQVTDSWKTYIGSENYFTRTHLDFALPVVSRSGGISNPLSAGGNVQTSSDYTVISPALYWRNSVHTPGSAWTFMPGVRLDYYSLTNETLPQPRIAARYALSDSLSLRTATGLYAQAPEDQQLDKYYGNPNLKSNRAWHAAFGAEKDFRNKSPQGWTISADGFFKRLYGLVIPSSSVVGTQPLYYENTGQGKAMGLEFLIKGAFPGYSLTVAYTLSRSTRWSPTQSEALFAYDQPHNLNLTGAVNLGRNWSLSSRLRYTSGNPYTPIIGGTFDADNDNYLPTRGPFYSLRQTPFFQVDARLDKKWIYDKWIFSIYLDIQNITNHTNAQGIVYSYDYSQKATVNGLPLLPTLGIKGEF